MESRNYRYFTKLLCLTGENSLFSPKVEMPLNNEVHFTSYSVAASDDQLASSQFEASILVSDDLLEDSRVCFSDPRPEESK